MVGGVDGRLLHLRPASYCSTTKGIRGISLFFSFAVPDLVFLRAELEESLHCLLVSWLPLSFDLGGVDQAHNASGHAGHGFSLVDLQPFLVPFGCKIDSPGGQGWFRGKASDDDRSFRLLGLDRVGEGAVYSGFSMVSFVGYTVGAARDPANASLDRGMERVLFSRVFQSHHRFLPSSPSDPEKEQSRWGVFLFLP